MKEHLNPSILVACGVVLGLAVGATYGIAFAAPQCATIAQLESSPTSLPWNCAEFWVARYQGLLGALLALVGAALTIMLIRAQIMSAERNNMDQLDALSARDLLAWEKTDGSLERTASGIKQSALECIEAIARSGMDRLDLYGGDQNEYVEISTEADKYVFEPTNPEVIMEGASPGVRSAFMDLTALVPQYGYARQAAFPGGAVASLFREGSTIEVLRRDAALLLASAETIEQACERVIVAAASTYPAPLHRSSAVIDPSPAISPARAPAHLRHEPAPKR